MQFMGICDHLRSDTETVARLDACTTKRSTDKGMADTIPHIAGIALVALHFG